MSYTYSDWISQSTPAAQLTRLRLYITELSNKLTNELSGDGFSKSANAIQAELRDLRAEEKILTKRVGRTSQGVVQVKFVDETTNGAGDDRDF